MFCVKERSINGVYGICPANVENITIKDFVRIGRALSIQSRMADYERLSRNGADKKYPAGLKDWLKANKDFKFVLLSEDPNHEKELIIKSKEAGGAQFNPINR